MKIEVNNVAEIGRIAKAARKQQHIRQDDLGSMIDCSHKFIGDVEKGKASVECGRVLRLLNELGIKVHLDLPDDIAKKLSP